MIDARQRIAEETARLSDRDDPLNIRRTAAAVLHEAEDVNIDLAAVLTNAGRLAAFGAAPPSWNTHYHFAGDERSIASFVLILDTLNYCFWPEPRWTTTETKT